MPQKDQKSGLNISKSLAAHANDDTDYGQEFIKLPGNISGGVARLIEARRGVYKTGDNKGKDFVYLAGAIIEPKTADDILKVWENGKVVVKSARTVKIEGARTGMTLPLCATKSGDNEISQDENVATMMNELRKIAGPAATAEVQDEQDLDNLLATLKETKPVFRFGTRSPEPSAKYPIPRTFEQWYGNKGLENYHLENGQHVEDDSASGAVTESADEPATTEEAPEPAAAISKRAEVDYATLAKKADKFDDEAAKDKLTEDALAAGVEQEEIDNAKNWAQVVTMIGKANAGGGGDEDQSQEEPGEWVPAVDDNVMYKPIDRETKKPVKKAVQCEVVEVDEAKKTVKLRNLANTKLTYSGVKWDALEGVS